MFSWLSEARLKPVLPVCLYVEGLYCVQCVGSVETTDHVNVSVQLARAVFTSLGEHGTESLPLLVTNLEPLN